MDYSLEIAILESLIPGLSARGTIISRDPILIRPPGTNTAFPKWWWLGEKNHTVWRYGKFGSFEDICKIIQTPVFRYRYRLPRITK